MTLDPHASALDVAAAIRSKEVSPVEVADHYLGRIDEVDPGINAFVWRNDDEVRDRAKRMADEVLAGGDLPPFFGVPIPIKDLTLVAGQPCTHGSRTTSLAPAVESELVVGAFERAGFVLMGRTNSPELGTITCTENLRYGITRNPWKTDRTPGGSSGGAGAAVAAGMAPVAHGNDGGGSIRIPSSCCGLVGLKPSRGRVPSLSFGWEGAAVEGALTRTVADAAAMLDVMAGPDPFAWYSAPAPARAFADEVGAAPGRLRIRFLTDNPLGLPVDQACVDAVTATAALLADLGHDVDAVPAGFSLFPLEMVGPFGQMVNTSTAGIGEDPTLFEPHNLRAHAAGQAVDSLQYVEAVHTLQRLCRTYLAAWGSDIDLLLTPTIACEPPVAGEVMAAIHDDRPEGTETVLRMVCYTVMANVSGQPGISLPMHMSASGLPVGIQLIGAPFAEATLIRVAAQLETAAPWSSRHPA